MGGVGPRGWASIVAAAAVVGCAGDDGAGPEPSTPDVRPAEPVARATRFSVVLEGPSGPFAAHLVLPTGGGPHALVVHVPGVGMHGLMDGLGLTAWGMGEVGDPSSKSFADLQMGTLSIDVGVDAQGTPRIDLPRSEVVELVRTATAWATARDDVAADGHVVVGTDFGVAAASTIAGEISAELVIWHWPELRTVGDYLEDEILRRDWFRRRAGDEDADGVLSAEEWGAFRATSTSSADADVTMADLDVDGDGVYSLADAELDREAVWEALQSLLQDDDGPAWTAFWTERDDPNDADRWQGHPALAWPSPGWARDAWEGPSAWSQLTVDGPPIVIIRDGRVSPMTTPLPRDSELGRASITWPGVRDGGLWGAVYGCLRVRRAPSFGDTPDDPCATPGRR